MRNKDIVLKVPLQDNDMRAQVLKYKSHISKQSKLENKSSRSSYAEKMGTIFIERKIGPVGPGKINMSNKDIASILLLQDNDMSAQVP